jgi:hypothetical protein
MTITPHNRGSIISTWLYTNWLVLSSLTQIAVVKSDAQYLFNTYSTFTITWDNAILLQHEDPTLKELIKDVVIPEHIHMDGTKEMTMGKWKQTCSKAGIKMMQTEKGSPWKNRTKVEIGELKRNQRRRMDRIQTYPQLWDFCMAYAVKL